MIFQEELIELMRKHRVIKMTGGVFDPRADVQISGACFEYEPGVILEIATQDRAAAK
jgi:hypothetical protein